jgi:integrase
MARRVQDRNLDTREARSRLKVRAKPHWRMIDRGLHLGYRKLKGGRPGTWTSRVYIAGKYISERVGSADDLADADGIAVLNFSQAQDEARKRMVRHHHGVANGIGGPLTVRSALDLYFESLEQNGRDASWARGVAGNHILVELGDVEVGSLKPEHLRAWLGAVPAKNIKPQTANRVWTILRAALNHAYREDKVDVDVWRKVKPLKVAHAARPDFLSVAQARRLVNACASDFRQLVQSALATGARYSELCRLQVADFNPDAGTLHVRQSKSGKDRHVVLTDEGVKLFAQLTAGKRGDVLILRRANGEPWKASDQRRPMLEACVRAKVSPPINFHALRHTWASLSAMAGMPLMLVAKNLGHADTTMVEKHYAHLTKSFETEAIRAGAPVFGWKLDGKVASMRRG